MQYGSGFKKLKNQPMSVFRNRHLETLRFIDNFIKKNEYAPSRADGARALGMSWEGYMYRLYCLEEMGYIQILRDEFGKYRGVKVLWLP